MSQHTDAMTERCAALLQPQNGGPQVDDETADHIIRIETDTVEMIDQLEEALAHWPWERLTVAQRDEVEDLVKQMRHFRESHARILALARELREGAPTEATAQCSADLSEEGPSENRGDLHGAPSPQPFILPPEVTMRRTRGPRGEEAFEFRHATLDLLGHIFIADSPRGGLDIYAVAADGAHLVPPEVEQQRRAYFGPLTERMIEWLKGMFATPARE